jgi:type VI secretion system protein ImpA
MANIESVPPVIDFEALLRPISEESPAGEPMQYSGLYDEIREARRTEKTVNQGDWQSEIKIADYRKVIDLAAPALSTQTKDLQLCVWLAEALTKQYGFAGLRDSLNLISQMEENFWDSFYPEIDEGDMEARANAIEWLDTQVSISIKTAPITNGSPRYSFLEWDESTRFEIPENISQLDIQSQEKFKALKTQAEQENRVTGDMWRSSKAQTNRAFYELLNLTLEECWAAVNTLDQTNEGKFDRNQTPSVRNLKKTLEDIRSQVGKLLEEKRLAEPDEDIPEESVQEVVGEGGEMMMVKGPAVATGAIQSRQDALKRLEDVAKYFQKTEPHSPVAHLIERAVKWGNMPLESWLKDVIKDESVVSQVRQILGFNTVLPDETQQQ